MGFLDRFRRKPKAGETVGLPGYTIFDGSLTNHEKNSELSGTRKYRTYAELIQNTSAVAAGVRAYLDFIGNPNWRVSPANDTPKARQYAEIIDRSMRNSNRPWHSVVKRSATYVLYGFDLQEITLKKDDDGVTVVGAINARPQHTIELWDVDPNGKVLGVVQRTEDGKEKYIPMWKCIYTMDDSLTDSPEGLGLLRQVVASSKKLARLEQLEAFGYETDLRGIPIGRAPLSALADLVAKGKMTEDEAAAITAPMKQFLERHVKTPSLALLLDSMVYKSTGTAQIPSAIHRESIELLQGSGVGLAEVSAAILRINHEIARVLGVEHILLGQDRGTQSLSRDKTDTFRMRIEGILSELSWIYQQQIVIPIAVANAWPKELIPTIEHDPIRQVHIEELATVFESMARAGAPLAPNDPVINAIRDIARLPRAPEFTSFEDTSLIGTTPPPEPGGIPNQPRPKPNPKPESK